MTTINCGVCGIGFCLPDAMYRARLKDGKTFCCPNGHHVSYTPSADEKRIGELERELWSSRRARAHLDEQWAQIYAQREELIGVLRECPIGCGYRSRRRIARDPLEMGRGIERVHADLVEHLQTAHGAHLSTQRLLPERTA